MIVSPDFISPYRIQGHHGGEARFAGTFIGAAGNQVVIVRFSKAVVSPGLNYAAGISIKKNSVVQTISSAVLQVGGQKIYCTLGEAAVASDVLTFVYDSGPGDLMGVATGNPIATILLTGVANEIPSILEMLNFHLAQNRRNAAFLI